MHLITGVLIVAGGSVAGYLVRSFLKGLFR